MNMWKKHLSRFVFGGSEPETVSPERRQWPAHKENPGAGFRFFLKGTVHLTIKHFSLGVFCCCFSFCHFETDAGTNGGRHVCSHSPVSRILMSKMAATQSASLSLLNPPVGPQVQSICDGCCLDRCHTPSWRPQFFFCGFSLVKFFLLDADFSSSWLFWCSSARVRWTLSFEQEIIKVIHTHLTPVCVCVPVTSCISSLHLWGPSVTSLIPKPRIYRSSEGCKTQISNTFHQKGNFISIFCFIKCTFILLNKQIHK